MWRTGWLGLGMKATWSGSEKGLDNKKTKQKKKPFTLVMPQSHFPPFKVVILLYNYATVHLVIRSFAVIGVFRLYEGSALSYTSQDLSPMSDTQKTLAVQVFVCKFEATKQRRINL